MESEIPSVKWVIYSGCVDWWGSAIDSHVQYDVSPITKSLHTKGLRIGKGDRVYGLKRRVSSFQPRHKLTERQEAQGSFSGHVNAQSQPVGIRLGIFANIIS